jgi:putative phosphoribosyl transferase
MRAAVRALRQQNPAETIVTVPIGSRDTCDHFRSEVDELVCGETPEPFYAVGAWYSNFMQTTDEEVRELLDRIAHERRVRKVQEHRAFAA